VLAGATHTAAACFRLATAHGMTMVSTNAMSSSSHLHGCRLQERLRAAHSLQQHNSRRELLKRTQTPVVLPASAVCMPGTQVKLCLTHILALYLTAGTAQLSTHPSSTLAPCAPPAACCCLLLTSCCMICSFSATCCCS
jgi:hypothetical protein